MCRGEIAATCHVRLHKDRRLTHAGGSRLGVFFFENEAKRLSSWEGTVSNESASLNVPPGDRITNLMMSPIARIQDRAIP